ncbi:DUF6048 family protein [Nonlabens agnitus]|uniref:Outer membrane protein beta-barrel domain-containing protein n=1 Tax=Nonlabens agnitus TaxID=870484 RepID=A0A2S9WUG1_9FLAO|nr:DUF6048 family protein [Nonlabens agnitus]PRP67108.1 hypothetical protein BST86_08345 [Nonlabens agnitus]
MLRYATSLLFVMVACLASAQQTTQEPVANDTIIYPTTYGLRAGIDLASLVRTAIDDEYTGFQVMADYRLTKDWYVAGELGTETLDRETNQIDFETSGSYIKAGADYNFYGNWLDLDNMIYVGFRAGASSFSQTLNRFDFYEEAGSFPAPSRFPNEEFDGLTAFWAEIQAGVKVQVLNNVYLSLNVQLKRLVAEDQPDNFDNLYIPGFGRTYDTGEIGVGYSYGISYRIPIYKK